MKALILIALLFSFRSFAANQCVDLFKISKKTITLTNLELQDLTAQINTFIKKDAFADVITGSLRPDWNHYNAMVGYLEKTENLNTVQANQIAAELKSTSQMIHKSTAAKIAEFKKDEDSHKKFNRFLDYNYSYFKLLDQLNKNLSAKIIPIPSFKEVPTEKQLISEGKKIVKNIELIANQKFSETGFQDHSDLKNKLMERDPKLEKLIDTIQNNLIVTVRRPESGRFWIPLTGFQNQRITESSKGSYYNDSTQGYISGRDRAESNLTNIPVNDYIPLSGRLKPNYGEARPAFDSDLIFSSMAGHYGSDLWVIKKSVIESRATWTPTDSLSAGFDKQSEIFIPWKHKILISLYAQQYYSSNTFTPGRILDGLVKKRPYNWNHGSHYFEVQIFGPLGLNDVEAFHFTQTPPDKKLFDLLKSKGIKVFDTRNNQNKEYFGEESR